jgi:GDP-4-dehydro-6-deoxy-D-mannose reductase
MRVLLTGITGFVGSHFAEFLLEQGVEVIGSLRWRSRTEHIEHLRHRLTLIGSDLRDLFSVRTLFEPTLTDLLEYWRQRVGSRSH